MSGAALIGPGEIAADLSAAGWPLAALAAIAVTDAAFAGFRAGLGRDGRVDHRAADRRGALRGVSVLAVLLVPVTGLAAVLARDVPAGQLAGAATCLLAVYLPFAVVVAGGLIAYRLSPWRDRYLALVLLLGPFTWARPVVALAGPVVLACRDGGGAVDVALAGGVLAALAVEPVVGLLWHRP